MKNILGFYLKVSYLQTQAPQIYIKKDMNCKNITIEETNHLFNKMKS